MLMSDKKIYRLAFICFGLAMLLNSTILFSADYAREKRWATEVIPGIIVGDAVFLKQSNGHEFLGIYAEGENKQTALIIVHGMGIHPDWGMVSTLRQRLNDYGYTTLSIQMPVLAKDASYKEYPAVFPEAAERLRLTVAYLIKQGYKNVSIVSHSNGSRMSRVFMASNPPRVKAWAALSLTQGDTFAGINVPVLDCYGERDLQHVLDSSSARKTSFQHPKSQQLIIPQVDHFFTGKEEEMVNAVKEFLATVL